MRSTDKSQGIFNAYFDSFNDLQSFTVRMWYLIDIITILRTSDNGYQVIYYATVEIV